MRKTDAKGRRLVQFYASGGRARKKPKTPKIEVEIEVPSDPMTTRTSTGIVGRKVPSRRMPTVGMPLVGALGNRMR